LSANLAEAGVLPAFSAYRALGGGYALLWEQVQTGRTVHAYLLAGPKGVGKATFARTLAASLFCTDSPKPCGRCDACRRVFTGNEPDVIEVFSDGDKVISIERVRSTIAQISQHSFGGGPRVVLVEPVEKLTPSAQNCLLKSLEDPPSNVIFFLLAHEPSALLGTVASRCLNVKLSPWPDRTLTQTLQAMGYGAQRVEALLPRAGGVIGNALSMLTDEASQGELLALVEQALGAQTDADVVTLSTALKDDRGGAERALAALEQALHQVLLMNAGLLPASSTQSLRLREWAEKSDADTLSSLIRAVFETRKRRQSQVNWQAGIDHLLMMILEAKTRWQQS